jgi:hypothetical protein
MNLFSSYSSLARQGLLFHQLDSIGTSRKTASATTVILWAGSNGRIKSYGTFQLLFWSRTTRPPLQRVGIPYVVQENRLPETTVNIWAQSNTRIKSYGAFQLLFRSGATKPPLHRVGIQQVVKGKGFPETTVNIGARSNNRIRSYALSQL